MKKGRGTSENVPRSQLGPARQRGRSRPAPPRLEFGIEADVVIAAIGVVRRIARIDQAAIGLVCCFIRIRIEDVLSADPHRVIVGDVVGQANVDEGFRAKVLIDLTIRIVGKIGPLTIVAKAAEDLDGAGDIGRRDIRSVLRQLPLIPAILIGGALCRLALVVIIGTRERQVA